MNDSDIIAWIIGLTITVLATYIAIKKGWDWYGAHLIQTAIYLIIAAVVLGFLILERGITG